MIPQDYSTSFVVNQTPDQVFQTINNVRDWWSGEIEGETDKLNAEFRYHYKDIHDSTQKIIELVPGKRIVWHVTKAVLSFVSNKNEWEGTHIIFDISEKDGKTEVRFTHEGLHPNNECYTSCSNGWNTLIHGNLYKLITTGQVQPNPFEPRP